MRRHQLSAIDMWLTKRTHFGLIIEMNHSNNELVLSISAKIMRRSIDRLFDSNLLAGTLCVIVVDEFVGQLFAVKHAIYTIYWRSTHRIGVGFERALDDNHIRIYLWLLQSGHSTKWPIWGRRNVDDVQSRIYDIHCVLCGYQMSMSSVFYLCGYHNSDARLIDGRLMMVEWRLNMNIFLQYRSIFHKTCNVRTQFTRSFAACNLRAWKIHNIRQTHLLPQQEWK